MCMPRCGSKHLQQRLANEQEAGGPVSTILPSPDLQRSNFWCSLEEFMSHTFKSSDVFRAHMEGNDVRFQGRYSSIEQETENRLKILKTLPNYVVKHFVYPDPSNVTSAMVELAQQVIVLRRRNIF
jgi:hypothetical protein